MINKVATDFFEPFHNPSTFRLMSWFSRPSITKSITELNTLVRVIILAPDFDAQDLVGFDAAKEHKIMDFWWMMSLSMLSSMDLLPSYWLVSNGFLFLSLWYMQWIIKRSEPGIPYAFDLLTCFLRVLMACIKYLSSCPCPCCLLQKSKISLLGSKSDMNARHRLIQVDSEQWHQKINLTQHLIFEGVNITNRNVEFFLQDESLVPTRVCFY